MPTDECVSQTWLQIQASLLLNLEYALGPIDGKHEKLVMVLELAPVEDFVTTARSYGGRPMADRAAIARSFIAKSVFGLQTTRDLIERLRTDELRRRLCCLRYRKNVPSESTFSRAFDECAESDLPQAGS